MYTPQQRYKNVKNFERQWNQLLIIMIEARRGDESAGSGRWESQHKTTTSNDKKKTKIYDTFYVLNFHGNLLNEKHKRYCVRSLHNMKRTRTHIFFRKITDLTFNRKMGKTCEWKLDDLSVENEKIAVRCRHKIMLSWFHYLIVHNCCGVGEESKNENCENRSMLPC